MQTSVIICSDLHVAARMLRCYVWQAAPAFRAWLPPAFGLNIHAEFARQQLAVVAAGCVLTDSLHAVLLVQLWGFAELELPGFQLHQLA